jgi:hypothetical protein
MVRGSNLDEQSPCRNRSTRIVVTLLEGTQEARSRHYESGVGCCILASGDVNDPMSRTDVNPAVMGSGIEQAGVELPAESRPGRIEGSALAVAPVKRSGLP